jgi:hypothetical protein
MGGWILPKGNCLRLAKKKLFTSQTVCAEILITGTGMRDDIGKMHFVSRMS